MIYSNDKIEKVIEERDRKISSYNYEIEKEIEKEKAKYIFSWKRFLLIIAIPLVIVIARKINKQIFPETSIWSWEYYMKK